MCKYKGICTSYEVQHCVCEFELCDKYQMFKEEELKQKRHIRDLYGMRREGVHKKP